MKEYVTRQQSSLKKKIIIIAAVSIIVTIGIMVIFLDNFSNQVPSQNPSGIPNKINQSSVPAGKHITIDLNESMSVAAH